MTHGGPPRGTTVAPAAGLHGTSRVHAIAGRAPEVTQTRLSRILRITLSLFDRVSGSEGPERWW